MRVIYCGLSGVGKDHLVRKNRSFMERLNIEHVSFADLMLEAAQERVPEINRDSLRLLDSATRRWLIDRAREMITGSSGRLLVNSHMVVEGVPLDEQTDVLAEKLEPSGVICIVANPTDILIRRASDVSRRRPCASLEQVERLQEFQSDMLDIFSSRLGIPIDFIDTSSYSAGSENATFERSLMNMKG